MRGGRASGSPRRVEVEKLERAPRGAESRGAPLALPGVARSPRVPSARRAGGPLLDRPVVAGRLAMAFEPIHDVLTGALVGARSVARHRAPSPWADGWRKRRLERASPILARAAAQRVLDESVDVARSMCERLRRRPWELFLAIGTRDATRPLASVTRAPRSPARPSTDPRAVALLPSTLFYDPATPIGSLVERWTRAGFHVAASVRSVGEGAACLRPGAPIRRMELGAEIVREALRGARERGELRALVERCRATGALLLARGVETLREVRLLADLGIDLVSGPLYAVPLTPSAFMLHALRAGGAGDWTIEDIEAERGFGAPGL